MFGKKRAFTLAEILLALIIVGIVAGLTLPSLLKDMQSKSRMNLLKSTFVGIDDYIHKDIAHKRSEDIINLDVYVNPQLFLSKFNVAPSGEPFAASYKNYNGQQVNCITDFSGARSGKILLQNGVGIGIKNPEASSGDRFTTIVVDLTGEKAPNTVGIDYFVAKLFWDEDLDKGIHVGDVHGFTDSLGNTAESENALRTACFNGNGKSCFRLVELTGYDPDFLGQEYK